MSADAFTSKPVLDWLRATVTETPLQVRIRTECEQEELPAVSMETGPLLALLARLVNAKRTLEIGCLLGYSGLWWLSGMPKDGKLESVEMDAEFAARALANFREAGAGERVIIHRGVALDVLPTLPARAYDVVFIDADKENMLDYLGHAVRLARPGGLVVADNVLWSGRVTDRNAADEETRAIQQYVKAAKGAKELETVILPVGDGVAVSRVR